MSGSDHVRRVLEESGASASAACSSGRHPEREQCGEMVGDDSDDTEPEDITIFQALRRGMADDNVDPAAQETNTGEAEHAALIADMLRSKADDSSMTCPWAVRPNQVGRSTDLSPSELRALKMEETLSRASSVSWQERGPARGSGITAWRGQKLRAGSQGGAERFSNRGGSKREMYAALARQGKLKPTPAGTKSVQNHHFVGKGGKGKGNNVHRPEATDRNKKRANGKSGGIDPAFLEDL